MKHLLIITVIMVAAAGASAQSLTKASFAPRPTYDRQFWASTAFYWSAVGADLATSRGGREQNGLLRNSRGGVSVMRTVGIAAIPYTISLVLQRRHPKAAGVLRWFGGGMHSAAAIGNELNWGKPR